MAIYRNKTQQFTVVSQSIIRDDRLSLKDFGLLVRLLSLPDNWEFSENGLVAIFKNDGQASIRTGLKHLEECGYLVRTRTRDERGRLGCVEWTIYDSPHLENHNVEKPNLENQTQYNTNKPSIKESTTKEQKKESKKAKRETFDSLIASYTENDTLRLVLGDYIQMRTAIRKPLTNRALELAFNKLDELARTDVEKIAILNQSILNSWQGLFPLKSNQVQRKNTDADNRFYPPVKSNADNDEDFMDMMGF